jgi:hypothetical protein
MSEEAYNPDEVERLFTNYGETALLLDAHKEALREPIKDASSDQQRKIIQYIEDQINNTHMKGNDELMQRFLYLWLFTIRQLDEGDVPDKEADTFELDFVEWEYQQFY